MGRDSKGREARISTIVSEGPFSSHNPNATIKVSVKFFELQGNDAFQALESSQSKPSLLTKLGNLMEGALYPSLGLLGAPKFQMYVMRVHVYHAKNLPATDIDGRADPFAVVRCCGQRLSTMVKHDTLNPWWYQTLQTTLTLPFPLKMAPPVQICIFDYDQATRNDFQGRVTIPCDAYGAADPIPLTYPLETWQGKLIPRANLTVCVQLFPADSPLAQVPAPDIQPKTKDLFVYVAILGLRDLSSPFGVHKTLISVELPGEKTHRFHGNPSNVPSAKDPNFLQVLKVPMSLPILAQFLPNIEIEVRDQLFGGVVSRLLGAASVDLRVYADVDEKTGAWVPSAGRPFDNFVVQETKTRAIDEKQPLSTESDALLPKDNQDVKIQIENADQPVYLIGRKTLSRELEQEIDVRTFETRPIRGNNRHVGMFKGLIKIGEDSPTPFPGLDLSTLLNPCSVYVRVYILNGVVVPKDSNGSSDPYLIVKLGANELNLRHRKLLHTTQPQFFESVELTTTLPGSSQLEISVMDWDGISDDLIGRTTIDLEDRWFSKTWQSIDIKPLERRSLQHPSSQVEQGHLMMWVEILRAEQVKAAPLLDIKPPPPIVYELRVIIWGVRDVPNLDELTDMNDLYVVCTLESPGESKRAKTDVHSRAKNGKGNFNWRCMFPLSLPTAQFPRLKFAVWDRDLVVKDDMIGEVTLSLHDLCTTALKIKGQHPVKFDATKIQVAHLENEMPTVVEKSCCDSVPACCRGCSNFFKKLCGCLGTNVERAFEPFPDDIIWIPLPKHNDKIGRIGVSIELLHPEIAQSSPAGPGRSPPNENPFLPEPSGRVQWSLLHPIRALRDLMGDKCLGRLLGCCCLFWCLLWIIMTIPLIVSTNIKVGAAFG